VPQVAARTAVPQVAARTAVPQVAEQAAVPQVAELMWIKTCLKDVLAAHRGARRNELLEIGQVVDDHGHGRSARGCGGLWMAPAAVVDKDEDDGDENKCL